MNEGTGETEKPNRTKRILVAALLVVAAGGLVWLAMQPREPSYQGKPLSFWLSCAETNSASFYDLEDPKIIECRQAIRAIGTNAIPALLRILKAKDSGVKRAVANLIDRQSLITIPMHSVEEQKLKAVAGFYLLGDLATNAVPALIEISKNGSYSSREIAAEVLMQLYPAKAVAVPYWLPAEKRAEWYMSAGMIQARSGSTTNVVLALSQAIELAPTNAEAWLYRGSAELELRQITDALSDFDRAMDLSASNQPAMRGRGWCKLASKDFRGAEADFTAALNWETNDARALNLRGLARANLRNFDGALQDFDKAIEIASYDAEIYRNRAMVEAAQTDYELALADVSKSLELENKDAVTWALRGRIQNALKNYAAAIADQNHAIQLNPKDSLAYAGRATARICVNDFTNATADLETALQLNPQNFSAFVVRGFMRAKLGGEDDMALADFEQAVELAPQIPETFGMLGMFQYKLGKWEPALENCRKALALSPELRVADYWSYIWLIRAQSGEQEAVNQELRGYLKSLDDADTNQWRAITAGFFSGGIAETNFLRLAVTAAKRPSAATNQVCESLFYAGMKRKIAGDKPGAIELFQKCLNTGNDNTFAYLNAKDQIRALK